MKRIGLNIFVWLICGLIMAACGGDGDTGSTATPPTLAQGQLVDAPVEGVEFTCCSQSGITGPNGEFTYEVGEMVRFQLGGLYLGEVMGKSVVTPLDLAASAAEPVKTAVNIARLLQSLDLDLSDERITIPRAVCENTQRPEWIADFQNWDLFNAETFEEIAGKLINRMAQDVKGYQYAVGLMDADTAAHHMAASLNKMGIIFDPSPYEKPDLPASLHTFASEQDLKDYLTKGLTQANRAEYDIIDMVDGVVSENSDSPSSEKDQFEGGITVSTTTLQEAGVDEADTIKTDGTYLYVAASANTGDAVMFEDESSPSKEKPEGEEAEIRILKLSAEPAEAVPVGAISLTEHKNAVDGLYLLIGRSDGGPDLLVTVGGTIRNSYVKWYNPWYWRDGQTEIGFYDVSDPTAPQSITMLRLDGQLIATRRIESTLYIVTRFTPSLPSYDPYMGDPAEYEDILAKTPLTELLPKIEQDQENRGVLIRPEFCYLPPNDDAENIQPTLVTVTAVDLFTPGQQISRSIAGPTDTVYVSRQAMYLASTRHYFAPLFRLAETDLTAPDVLPPDKPPPEITDIHKFALTPNGPEYIGSGEVTGNLGWEADKRSFRMGENDDVLRVATSLGDTWNMTSSTRLSLLRESPAGGLELISYIDHIGKPGERLYAARFIGTRGYLVTFRVTDPLYVFDLSDPENPQAVGELHIEGYSDYLHPIGDSLILGIGKDAVPDTTSPDFGGRGAWYQGVKLALFDVSTGSQPMQRHSVIIGKRGTDSDALMDHHALAYLPPVFDRPARLALPIRLHETIPQNDWYDPDMPNASYYWTHTGLYLFAIDPDAGEPIHLQGRMVVESSDGQAYPYYTGYSDRAVLLGDSAHYIHNSKVWSASWVTPENSLIGPR